jgi:hypothetical protein
MSERPKPPKPVAGKKAESLEQRIARLEREKAALLKQQEELKADIAILQRAEEWMAKRATDPSAAVPPARPSLHGIHRREEETRS